MKIRYFNVQMKLIKPGTVVNGETLYEWLLSETQQKVFFLSNYFIISFNFFFFLFLEKSIFLWRT